MDRFLRSAGWQTQRCGSVRGSPSGEAGDLRDVDLEHGAGNAELRTRIS